MKDDSILNDLISKNEKGLSELQKKYVSYAMSIAIRLTGSVQDAEECVNDAFLNIWQNCTLSEETNLKGLVAVCVRRKAVDLIRHHTAKKRCFGSQVLLDELAETIPDNDTIDSQIDRQQVVLCIKHFVQELNQFDRTIFLQRYFYGMDIKSIARFHLVSRSTIDSRLFRCRSSLKKQLQKLG